MQTVIAGLQQEMPPLVMVVPPKDPVDDLPVLLLRELQHRTNNVLHHALLILEVGARRADGAEARSTIADVARSFRSLVDGQRHFCALEPDRTADAAEEVSAACASLAASFRLLRPDVRFECVVAENPRWSVTPAGALAMIVNELVTNAYKHAFRDREGGSLRVTLAAAPQGRACITVIDDGIGFIGAHPGSGSGVGIVASLARAIGGSFTLGGDDPHRSARKSSSRRARPPPHSPRR